MGKKKKVGSKNRITVKDYIKAIKKADREIQLEQQPGWRRVTTIHESKKAYSRKENKNNFLDKE